VLQAVAAIQTVDGRHWRFAADQEASPAIRDRLIDGQHSPVRNRRQLRLEPVNERRSPLLVGNAFDAFTNLAKRQDAEIERGVAGRAADPIDQARIGCPAPKFRNDVRVEQVSSQFLTLRARLGRAHLDVVVAVQRRRA